MKFDASSQAKIQLNLRLKDSIKILFLWETFKAADLAQCIVVSDGSSLKKRARAEPGP